MSGNKTKISLIAIIFIAFIVSSFIFSGTATVRAYDLRYIVNETVTGKYNKDNRNFAAIPSVESTGNRLWCAWMSGGDKEPHKDNYITVACSDDKGKTWVEPVFIIDSDVDASRTYNPVLWHDNDGKLWIFWGDAGVYCSCINNPEAKLNEIVWTTPKKINSSIIFNKPIIIQNEKGEEEWIMCTQNYESSMATLVYSSTDKGTTWTKKSEVVSILSAKMHHEPMMTQKNDGSLWMLSRVENGEAGGLEQTFSYDNGKTWTSYQYDLQTPLRGPGSRFNIYKLKSGNIVVVNHDSTNKREKIAIWLSLDDGKTFPYKLMLDDRDSVSYPDIAQDGDGKIYVVYDVGRSVEQEIRMACFFEDDIKAEDFVSDGAYSKIMVTKTGDYIDLLYTAENYDTKFTVKKGESLEQIISELPNTVTAIADNGETYVINGEWEMYGTTEKVGTVLIKFSAQLPELVRDLHDLLTVKINVVDNTDYKLRNTIIICAVAVFAVSAGTVTGVVIYKKWKGKKHE